jgi:predicted nuclease of restriction endonuclease-like RecB superfamily
LKKAEKVKIDENLRALKLIQEVIKTNKNQAAKTNQKLLEDLKKLEKDYKETIIQVLLKDYTGFSGLDESISRD